MREIQSISLETVNRMNPNKLLFGDGLCEICGGDEPVANIDAISYCWICFRNRVDNQAPSSDEEKENKNESEGEGLTPDEIDLLHRIAAAEAAGVPLRLAEIIDFGVEGVKG